MVSEEHENWNYGKDGNETYDEFQITINYGFGIIVFLFFLPFQRAFAVIDINDEVRNRTCDSHIYYFDDLL